MNGGGSACSSVVSRVEDEAQTRWADSLGSEHPLLAKWLNRTRPSSISVPRVDVVPLAEFHAIRQLAQTRELVRAIGGGVAYDHRWTRRAGPEPADGRIASALLEGMAFLRGQPNMLSMWDNLRVSNPFLHWPPGVLTPAR